MSDRSRGAAGFAPLTGALFVVLTVVGVVLGGDPPDSDAAASEIVEYWSDNDTAVMLGSLLTALGAVALIFFASALYRALRRGEHERGILALAAFGGGIVTAGGIGVDAAIRFTAANVSDEVDPIVVTTLNALWADFFFPIVLGLATLILATSLHALRSAVVPAWLAWVGFAVAVSFFTPAGFVGFLVGALWILVLSVILWRGEAAPASAPA